MALGVLASLRTTVVVTVVAASVSTPVVFSGASGLQSARSQLGLGGSSRHHAEQVQVEPMVIGNVAFDKPVAWRRLSGAGDGDDVAADGAGTVVARTCPGESDGAGCSRGATMTFVSYSGERGHALPELASLQAELAAKLPGSLPGYQAGTSVTRASADGTRYLDVQFSWRDSSGGHVQRVAAFRGVDGRGVVVLTVGRTANDVSGAVSTFLSSAHDASGPAA